MKFIWCQTASTKIIVPSFLAVILLFGVTDGKDGEVWPLPRKITYGTMPREFCKDSLGIIAISDQLQQCDIFQEAKRTYLNEWLVPWQLTLTSSDCDCDDIPSLSLKVHLGNNNTSIVYNIVCNNASFPNDKMNEEYTLKVPAHGEALLEAPEIWGILRGLETFSQLIFPDYEQKLFIRTAVIVDSPEYEVRGILLDTGRHFLSVNMIKRQIDLMAQNKFNMFHWHFTDLESFPFYSEVERNLTKEGAFTQRHIYTPQMVKEILGHSRIRGIRVVVEFDTPGHMASWRGAKIMAECRDQYGNLIDSNMLDPSREETYLFLQRFFSEVINIFPDTFIHLGGDEAHYWSQNCWANNPTIRKFMAEKNMNTISQLLNYYTDRLTTIIKNLQENRKQFTGEPEGKVIVWQEVFDRQRENTDSKMIVHNWLADNKIQMWKDTKTAVSKGHTVLVSSCWYLNYIKLGADWKESQTAPSGLDPYYCNPRGFDDTEEEKKLVLGGIATMWGEYVDGTNLEPRLWPRASAVAERLWSAPESTTNADLAVPRLQEHRCRMVARGYNAQPANGPGFCLYSKK